MESETQPRRRLDWWDYVLIIILLAVVVACTVLVVKGPPVYSIFQNINNSM